MPKGFLGRVFFDNCGRNILYIGVQVLDVIEDIAAGSSEIGVDDPIFHFQRYRMIDIGGGHRFAVGFIFQ